MLVTTLVLLATVRSNLPNCIPGGRASDPWRTFPNSVHGQDLPVTLESGGTTNPENGTASYTYNANGTLATKHDASGNTESYTYDAYERTQRGSARRPAGQRAAGTARRSQTVAVCSATCVLFCLPLLKAGDTPVPMLEVHHVLTSIAGATDRPFLMLDVSFDANLRNLTGTELRVAQTPTFLTSVYRLVGPEKWQLLQTLSYYPTAETKIEECQTVRPGQEFDFGKVPAMATLKRADIKPGARIVLRFYLDAVCRQGSKVLTQPLVTGPVELEVPRW